MDFLFMKQPETFFDYPLHDHGYWEILLSLKGSGVLVADGEEFAFLPGTIFCIRPGVKHTKHAASGFADASLLTRDFCFDALPNKVLVFQDDAAGSFRALFELGNRYQGDPDSDVPASRFQRSILEAMQNLLRHWRDEASLMPQLIRFRDQLYAHIGDIHFDLSAAIASSGYSPSHLRRLFREQYGCSPVQYFNQLKVQLAKEELLRSASVQSIGQIAHRCGFSDPYYFSRVFKQVTGQTPSQFYEQSRQGLDMDIVASDQERIQDRLRR